jgi:hypothetical protein
VLARMDGAVVHRHGSQEVFQWKALLQSLFGDSKAVSNTYSSLQDQLSPQLFSQGQTYCVLLDRGPATCSACFSKINATQFCGLLRLRIS